MKATDSFRILTRSSEANSIEVRAAGEFETGGSFDLNTSQPAVTATSRTTAKRQVIHLRLRFAGSVYDKGR